MPPRGSNPGCADRFRLPSRRTAPAPQSHASRGARTPQLVRSRPGEAHLPYTATGRKNTSATRARTRVAGVRAEYPNQLDYSGILAAHFNIVCSESENIKGRTHRVRWRHAHTPRHVDMKSGTHGDHTRIARIGSGSPPAGPPPPRNPMRAGARGRHNWSQVARVKAAYLTRLMQERIGPPPGLEPGMLGLETSILTN